LSDPAPSERRPGAGAAVLSLMLAALAAGFLILFAWGKTCTGQGDQVSCVTSVDQSLLLSGLAGGGAALVASGLPVAMYRTPAANRARALGAAVLTALVVLGLFIARWGILFAPSALTMVVAAMQGAGTARPQVNGKRGSTARVLTVAALGLTVAATLVLLFVPFGEQVTVEATLPGEPPGRELVERTTLLQEEGPTVIGLLAVPVAFSALPLIAGRSRLVRPMRMASAVLLTGFTILGLFSVGLLFAPAALTMVAAAALETR
jgi:hypothetical protein